MKNFFTSLLLFLCTGIAWAEPGNFSVRHIGVERGLSNNHVVSVTQDKNGFIWIATDEGLNRFDGYSFKTYFKNDEAIGMGLSGNELNAVLDDPHRPILWIATQRDGLNSYDYSSDTFKGYCHDDSNPQSLVTDDVTALAPAADGGIWLGTYWRGIDHLDPDSGIFTHYSEETVSGFPSGAVLSIIDSGDGFLYVAHESNGLSIIDLKKKTAVNYMPDGQANSLPTGKLNCIFKDGYNNIWIGTAEGLLLFNRDEGTFTNFGSSHSELRHNVSDIHQFDEHQLWVAMEQGGIAILELNDSTYNHPVNAVCRLLNSDRAETGLSSQSVRTIFKDSYSNVWAGTWGGGLNLITSNLPAFRLHDATPAGKNGDVISSNSILTAIFDDDHRLWIGRDGGGLDLLDGKKIVRSYNKARNNLSGDIVQASHKGADGTLYFGMFNNGACRYNPATKSFTQLFTENPKEDVRDIANGAGGDIIFATSRGIWTLPAGASKVTGPVNLGNNLIRKVLRFDDDRYLIGTFGDGMFITDSKFKPICHLNVKSGLPSNTVNDIFESRDGHVWVATGDGLLEFSDILKSPTDFKLFNRTSGLKSTHVQSIAQDKSGIIWISSNGGISCIRNGEVLNYEIRDNAPLRNFLSRSVATDLQGNIYFGAVSGLCMFNPIKVLEKVAVPAPVITEVTIAGPSGNSRKVRNILLAGQNRIQLSAVENSFYISFMISNFALADEVEYSYKLEGLEDEWTEVRSGNYVNFRELSPGKYTFIVRARVRNQEWGEPSALKIVIDPPFYLSWWAKILYVLLVAGIVAAALYLYRRRLTAEAKLRAEQERRLHEQALTEERLRFYTNITHELRTPLTLIMGPLEDLSSEQTLSQQNRSSLQMVTRNASRLLDLVNRLLEFRKTETNHRRLVVRRGNIASVVYEVALKYKELNRNSKVKVNISTDSGNMECVFDKEVITVILDNLISNALKYTNSGSIDVDCHESDGHIELSVKDTGKGMSPEILPKVFERFYQEEGPHQAAGTGIGLALVKNLVDIHQGVMAVKSAPGKGSEFIFTIPKKADYTEAIHIEEETGKQTSEPIGSGNSDDSESAMAVPEDMADKRPVVLFVEDNADIRDYVKQSFTDLYETHTAENGQEGLEKALKLIPNVIISDIMMPVMDGYEFLKRLKKDVRTSHIPVIMLTAKDTNDDRRLGYQTGASSYLTKPFSSSVLQARINNLLLERMKFTESFKSLPASIEAQHTNKDTDSLERKKEKLMKSLSEVDREFVEKLNRTITDNVPDENVDVNFLSGVFCMSASTLYRKVKGLTGLSPNEYVRKKKMQMAEELLLKGRYTFSEIAYKVGMNSIAYFRSCFKEEFGMTPSEYLRRVKENSEK